MNRRSFAALGLALGTALEPSGRARRWELDRSGKKEEERRELWRLGADDEAVADRLLGLGQAGVGGFEEGGLDEEGAWLLRTDGTPLAQRLRDHKGPWPWREAATLTASVARALGACEKAALFPGPVSPETVSLAGDRALLNADALVGALVGAAGAGARDTTGVSPLWTPPEQSDGAMWDAAANRYVLGLLLYRLLSGSHPFGGAGLRHAMGEASWREAPPFVDNIAASLPSGLQSLALRLLDPEAARRPSRAVTIAEELERFLEGRAANVRYVARPEGARLPLTRPSAPAPAPAPAPASGSSRARSARSAGAELGAGGGRGAGAGAGAGAGGRSDSGAKASITGLWPIAAGILVAFAATAAVFGAKPAPTAKVVTIPPAPPLVEAQTDAATCASCHTRQAAEWRRSVMAHSVKSPLFNALEALIEEQVGRDQDCPGGAGILRRANPSTACRDRATGIAVTGSGGEHWCINCHSPTENLATSVPAWDGRVAGDPRSRLPVRDALGARPLEGISCGFCHQVHGPVGARGAQGYQGNPTWTSTATGSVFPMRPEDGRGLFGIGNSGYDLRPEELILGGRASQSERSGRSGPAPADGPLVAHARPSSSAQAFVRTSEFCGGCHDVRLFGTDGLGAARGEHFKRLRNAYSEWSDWAKTEARAGRAAASCQDCHMSTYPGVCEPDPNQTLPATFPTNPAASGAASECPPGTRFAPRKPGSYPSGRSADASSGDQSVVLHYFSGVDVPLTREFPDELVDEPTVDVHGVPLSARRRRDLLIKHTFRFTLGTPRRGGAGLEIPLEIENTGAGHRVPAGFSQEREIWVHLVVRDEAGRVLYEVGRVDRNDDDLHDKVFDRVTTRSDQLDARGRPEGLFGADVRDGPDVPLWSPSPILGGTSFRGRGLVNFQNGFLRCVRCIGVVGPDGRCQAGLGQNVHRADRFADGDYDQDTGECRSNLRGFDALFETYMPVGALDASRGLVKGPDAIVDTRSAPPGVPIRYTYDLPTEGRRGPFKVEARLLFRAFPPYLVRAFAAYEREQARRGQRPSGALVTDDMLRRLEVVELARATAEIR